jgi:hypothetical protein
MEPFDVDEVMDVDFSGSPDGGDAHSVEVTFKDGSTKKFSGADMPEALALLSHWTPPTA